MTKWPVFLLSALCLLSLGADTKPQPPREFKSVLEIIQTVPREMYPADARGWTEIKIAAVNDVLKDKVKEKQATFGLSVHEVKLVPEAEPGLRLTVVAAPIQVGQTTVHVWCYFDEDQKARLTALNPGEKLTITGKVWNPRFARGKDGGVPLIIDLYKCNMAGDRKPTK